MLCRGGPTRHLRVRGHLDKFRSAGRFSTRLRMASTGGLWGGLRTFAKQFTVLFTFVFLSAISLADLLLLQGAASRDTAANDGVTNDRAFFGHKPVCLEEKRERQNGCAVSGQADSIDLREAVASARGGFSVTLPRC